MRTGGEMTHRMTWEQALERATLLIREFEVSDLGAYELAGMFLAVDREAEARVVAKCREIAKNKQRSYLGNYGASFARNAIQNVVVAIRAAFPAQEDGR